MTAHPPTVAVVIALQPPEGRGARRGAGRRACRPARTTRPRHAIDVACIVPTALLPRAWRIGPTRGSESAPCTAMHGNGNAECNNLKSMAGHEHANRRGQNRSKLDDDSPRFVRRAHSKRSSSCPHPSMSRAGLAATESEQPLLSAHRMKRAPGSKGTRYLLAQDHRPRPRSSPRQQTLTDRIAQHPRVRRTFTDPVLLAALQASRSSMAAVR